LSKLSLLPREGRFFVLFDESARNAAEVALLLKNLIYNWNENNKDIKAITELEHKGDGITHEIIALVHRTFVTPFDREDIALLAHSLDDVVDFIESTADAMSLYDIKEPTQRAKELADVIMQITAEVREAISELRRKVDLKQILKRSVEINRLENMADSNNSSSKIVSTIHINEKVSRPKISNGPLNQPAGSTAILREKAFDQISASGNARSGLDSP